MTTKKINTVIIPAAGLGTRMLPITATIPKEMLPIVDIPLIQYSINECILSGLYNIILITKSCKYLIESYLDCNINIYKFLEKKRQSDIFSKIKLVYPSYVTITYIHQKNINGLGNAILSAFPIIKNQPFAVVLPDIIINEYTSNLKKDNLSAMLKRFQNTGRSQILVKKVRNFQNYGIVYCEKKSMHFNKHAKIIKVIEKPNINNNFSNLSIVGRYVFSKNIWKKLKKIKPGKNEEFQLTDAIDLLIQDEIVEAYPIIGLSHDCGNKLGYMQAFVQYGLYHKKFGKIFKKWIKSII
ncbi:glucose-1-phosphate uridylyltransferase [Wigglesworthia glossinidia endosymbiont of Glossina morsitans morsitans (Yale colony)]|uniref:UTP--glucose-1-phosphate uridylyltransferase n=1 Tax=Wigglesworthia glossinidia endosymbiont of Glossina morsitans morsitans (Yale colony) TaxID=1142511 RepID=H6Q4U6_WIGGL|nr:sugar phosphate nucleotidyltransferase [Wigglesworthia glossinidia]AFA41229.1 glucose-1-phosphate uridylyltransferase [Wigglesworthia glossinidia endosymbiont of Glossina morsitans morsitans (Yale colony)]